MRYASLPVEQLTNWALLNQAHFTGAAVVPHIFTTNGSDKGGGLLATANMASENIVLSVPADLIVCKETVHQCAKVDKHLRQILDAVGDFGQVGFSKNPRKCIMIFLLMQIVNTSPDMDGHAIGVKASLTDYVQFLPKDIPLPTFYTAEERDLLAGTSLAEALDQKMMSLEQEFEHFRSSTGSIGWCQKAWWDEETGQLNFNDWKLADALYRSRGLELPKGIGDAMVPLIDMVNHASGDECNARFDVDESGRVVLLLQEGKSVKEAEEITIVYGAGSACEMVFSYGFLEEGAKSAREMFLSLSIAPDDPLRVAKIHFSNQAPGVRIYVDTEGRIQWDSGFVWWACVNEEDGLDFQVLQNLDGDRELQALWQGERIQPSELKTKLFADSRKNIFLLRAVVTIQERVERQGEELGASEEYADKSLATGTDIRQLVHETILRLRRIEMDLLTACYASLETEKQRLLASRMVSEYLDGTANSHPSEGPEEEDFS